jgi:PLP dependent protein
MSGNSREVECRLAENLAGLRQRIDAAAQTSGRDAISVTLVAATKYVSSDVARAIVAAGCADLGESRPQEFWSKAAALADQPVRWHFIGHLQRNKVRRTLPEVTLFHSIDSRRLLAALDEESAALGRRASVLLEVNISAEEAKHGFAPADVERLLDAWPAYRHVEVRGLMGMARLEGGPAAAERDFAELRKLRDRLAAGLPPGVTLDELSMGMSGDFEAAIRHGATHVRIGSALTAGLPKD